MIWKTPRLTLDLSRQGLVMGILNVTPDSFSDGGLHASTATALTHARAMIAEGAAIIDVGGESTRPGAAEVAMDEEIQRVVPVIQALRHEWDGLISIDTWKPEVAEAALSAGADIVNDIQGLRAEGMVDVCARHGCGVVIMHMQGTPRTMQLAPHYEDVVAEVTDFFRERLETALAAGIPHDAIVLDPGIGFGKSVEHNLSLIRAVPDFLRLGRPILMGVSRKSFIGKILDRSSVSERDAPTVALTSWTRESGAMIHRVHEVRSNFQALRMTEAILYLGEECA
jgi:dihydropteroate synthase